MSGPETTSAERLQKVLAQAGVGSRRHVEELIREGRITVNGEPAVLGQKADLAVDAVKVDGKRIGPASPHRVYVLVNKPRNVVSTRSDPENRPTVLEIVPQRLRGQLRPVGRLDFDSEGLLLLTDDGDLAQKVAHPRHGCVKTYEVKVKGRPEEAAIDRLRHGVRLSGRMTAPARIARIGRPGQRESVQNSWWQVQLGEGRTRQIREMFFRIGHPVQKLRRVAIGPVSDGSLTPGHWRELREDEVEALRRGGGPRRPTRPAGKRPQSQRAGGGRPDSKDSKDSKDSRGSKSTKPSKGKGKGASRPGGRAGSGRGPGRGGSGRGGSGRSGPGRGGSGRGGSGRGPGRGGRGGRGR